MSDIAIRRAFVAYLSASLAISALHSFLPAPARMWTYGLVCAAAIVPLWCGLRRQHPSARIVNWLMMSTLAILTIGDGFSILDAMVSPRFALAADITVTVAHVVALAAALSVAAIRGRNDIGGLVDVAVLSIAGGGLLWTTVLQPSLAAAHVGVGHQLSLLINTLVLTGVLGTVGRLLQTSTERILALWMIFAALVLALVGNVAMQLTTGSLTTGRPAAAEALFLVTYTLLGATGLHPSQVKFADVAPPCSERLSAGRLAFLGLALAAGPVVGAGRQLVGLPVDGLLLALGTVFTVPLVMVRIGFLTSQRLKAEHELVHQATHDALTGLVNRAEFLTRLEAAMARQAARHSSEILVLFCDLDGFKDVNDQHGHTVGDELLIAVASRLKATVAAQDTLARYGGDEFLILCETTNPVAAQASLGRRIRATIGDPFELAGLKIHIGVSIGAVVADDHPNADTLISHADAAMYAVKQRRRGHLAASA